MDKSKLTRYLPLIIIVAVSLLVGTFYYVAKQAQEQRMAIHFASKIDEIDTHFKNNLVDSVDVLAALITSLKNDARFTSALNDLNQQKLLKISESLFQQLRDEHQITHFYFHAPDRVNLLRVHQPERYGDTIDRTTTLLAESSGELSSGLELGPLGTLTLRVVSPWHLNGRLIGYVELGTEIEHLIDKLKSLFGVETLSLLDKQLVERSGWESTMVKYGRSPEWEILPKQIVNYATNNALIEPLAAQYDHINSGNISLGEKYYRSGRLAIKDVSNRVVGELVILEAINRTRSAEDNVIFKMDIIYALLGGLMVAILLLSLRTTQRLFTGSQSALEQAQKELSEAFDAMQDPVFLHDENLRIIHINQAYVTCADMERDDIIGRPYWEVFPKLDGPLETCKRRRTENIEEAQNEELCLDTGITYESRSYPIFDNASHYKYSIHILQDITETKEAEKQLRQAAIAFDNTIEGIMVTNPHGEIMTVNNAFSEITGYSREEAIGNTPRLLKSSKHDANFYEIMWNTLRSDGHWQGEIWNQRKDGEVYPELLTITSVLDSVGEITHYIAIFADLSEIKSSQDQIQRLSHYDSLTELPNRLLFNKLLTRQLQRAEIDDRELAVVIIDLNQFEQLNETLGHASGDQLLRLVAERLVSVIRPADSSAHLGLLFEEEERDYSVSRVAGDQFAFVLSNLNESAPVTKITRRILDSLAEPYHLDDSEIFITASAGITIFPHDGRNADILLKQAHAAANNAKKSGRSNYHLYSKELSNAATERLTLESGLRRAIERNELILYYQPQVSMTDGHIIGFEALIRWRHPEMGMIPPDKFIGLAEQTGLIVPIGEWVLHTACNQAKRWHEAGLNPGVMAVNVSGVQIEHYDLAAVVEKTLKQTGLDPKHLEIELTESSVMQSPDRAITQLEQMKSLGTMLAIDDFGTGFSSLSHLLKFPFDKLKIDRSFVINITTKPDDAILARSIIAMAQGMSLRVIAEGVETEEQLYYLKRNGCDELQGYLFSRPVDAQSAENLLTENRKLSFSKENIQESQMTLLIVDDEENILRSLKRLLRRDGYQILAASNADEALQLMARHHVQVILSDMRMPEISGTELLKQIRDLYPDTIRMILSGYADINAVTEAVNSGWLYKFLVKPWNDEELKEQISEAFKLHKNNQLNKRNQ